MAPSDEATRPIAETLDSTAATEVPATEIAPDTARANDDVPSGGAEAGCSSKSQADGDHLVAADEFFDKGSKALEDDDFVTAVDCLSRALEIRVAHYGELAPDCLSAYYKYGCALLYKAQEEADPLGNVLKQSTNSAASATVGNKHSDGSLEGSVSSRKQDDARSNGSGAEEGKEDANGDEEAGDEDSGDEEADDVTEADEDDDSDLDLAWKMLDIARAISEKLSGDTLEKAKIFSALAEVSMEREDFETSLGDYRRALSIVEKLVEPAHRRIIELNFRICLVLEVSSKIEEAIPYCEKAISLCKHRLQYLNEELLKIKDFPATLPDSSHISSPESGNKASETQSDSSIQDKEEEIQVIGGFQAELEKKLEDLQQAITNPKSILSEYLKMVAEKSASEGKDADITEAKSEPGSSSQVGTIKSCFDSPAVSTAASNGTVTHLGVVGRGVKRASLVPLAKEPPKMPATGPSENATDSAPDNSDSSNVLSSSK